MDLKHWCILAPILPSRQRTAKLAKELNAVTTISLSTKMGDDAAIWAEIASHKATSSIKFGTCLKELPELATPFLGWTAGMV